MSRSRHQFRPGALELFETRIVPAVVATPLPGVFYPQPPEYDGSVTQVSATHFAVDLGLDPTGNTISTLVTNNTNVDQTVTLTIYAAPGGREKLSHNFASQNLAFSQTYVIPANGQLTISKDISDDDVKLTGQQTFQADIFFGDLAPDKVNHADLTHSIVIGDLFDYSEDGKPGWDR